MLVGFIHFSPIKSTGDLQVIYGMACVYRIVIYRMVIYRIAFGTSQTRNCICCTGAAFQMIPGSQTQLLGCVGERFPAQVRWFR